MNDVFIKQCLDVLGKEDICSPVITLIYNIVNPYIYFSMFFIFLLFFGILSNTIILLFIWRQIQIQDKNNI